MLLEYSRTFSIVIVHVIEVLLSVFNNNHDGDAGRPYVADADTDTWQSEREGK